MQGFWEGSEQWSLVDEMNDTMVSVKQVRHVPRVLREGGFCRVFSQWYAAVILSHMAQTPATHANHIPPRSGCPMARTRMQARMHLHCICRSAAVGTIV